jgi:hypothetical protein
MKAGLAAMILRSDAGALLGGGIGGWNYQKTLELLMFLPYLTPHHTHGAFFPVLAMVVSS